MALGRIGEGMRTVEMPRLAALIHITIHSGGRSTALIRVLDLGRWVKGMLANNLRTFVDEALHHDPSDSVRAFIVP